MTSLDSLLQHAPVEKKAPAWWAEVRKSSRERARELGVPHRKLEDWRYTAVKPLFTRPWAQVPTPSFDFDDSHDFERLSAFRPQLEELLDSNDIMEQLALALGPVEMIEADHDMLLPLDLPQQDYFIPRLRFFSVSAGKNARLIETFRSSQVGKSWQCTLTLCQVAKGACLEHAKIQTQALGQQHFSSIFTQVERDGQLLSHIINMGSDLARHRLRIDLLAEGAKAQALGFYGVRGEAQCDNLTAINHRAAHTESDQVYKGLLNDQGRGVFQGKVAVGAHCSKVSSSQLNNNLTLSAQARAFTKPTLLIDHDDVKCAHGATVGQLDREEIFYLQSRGLPYQRAIQTLAQGFAGHVLNRLSHAEIRRQVQNSFDAWMKEQDHSSQSRNLT